MSAFITSVESGPSGVEEIPEEQIDPSVISEVDSLATPVTTDSPPQESFDIDESVLRRYPDEAKQVVEALKTAVQAGFITRANAEDRLLAYSIHGLPKGLQVLTSRIIEAANTPE